MKAEQFIALDVETTGVDFSNSQVLQCGVIILDNNMEEKEVIEWNVNYREEVFEWNSEAEEIHGIPKEVAKKHGIEIEQFLDVFEKTIFKNYGIQVDRHLHIIAANAHFDYLMLKNIWERYKKTPFPISHRFADINSAALVLFGKSGLSFLLNELNIEHSSENRHSALYDARLHLEVFKKLQQWK